VQHFLQQQQQIKAVRMRRPKMKKELSQSQITYLGEMMTKIVFKYNIGIYRTSRQSRRSLIAKFKHQAAKLFKLVFNCRNTLNKITIQPTKL
jgi:hypothetical protein